MQFVGIPKRPTLGMIMVDGDVKLGKDQTKWTKR